MVNFNLQGQTNLGTQNFAGGDMTIGSIENRSGLTAEVQRLLAEVARAREAGDLDPAQAETVETSLARVEQELQVAEPRKSKLSEWLVQAKSGIKDVVAVAGMYEGLDKLITMINPLS